MPEERSKRKNNPGAKTSSNLKNQSLRRTRQKALKERKKHENKE